jgi:hypothetical protein
MPELRLYCEVCEHATLPVNLALLSVHYAVGSSAPFRVLNTYVRPNISAAGGLSNFSLALVPHLGPPGAQPSTPVLLTASQPPLSAADLAKLMDLDPGVSEATVDWEAVFLNGHSCSKIPSRSLLMNDCSGVT